MSGEVESTQLVRTRNQNRRRWRELDEKPNSLDLDGNQLNRSDNKSKFDVPDKTSDEILNRSENRVNRRVSRQLELMNRENKVVQPSEQISGDVEKQAILFTSDYKDDFPSRVLEPIRTDPVNALQARQRRLERIMAKNMPEYHYLGQICSGRGITLDTSEGAYCRWKIDYGKAWQHVDGEILGQTHVAYTSSLTAEDLIFNHPLDLHFAEIGFQGWGSPRISVQCSRVDWHGRRLLGGYGFAPLPSSSGYHRIEIPLWRPTGSLEEELNAYFLGNTPALVGPEPIYDSAWRERCRLVTMSAGMIIVELFVVDRNTITHSIDHRT